MWEGSGPAGCGSVSVFGALERKSAQDRVTFADTGTRPLPGIQSDCENRRKAVFETEHLPRPQMHVRRISESAV